MINIETKLYPVEELEPLMPPFEIFDIPPSAEVVFHITDWAVGRSKIHPRFAEAPPSKIIPILRIGIDPAIKDIGPPYFDITSKTLQATLLPYLETPDYKDKLFRIKKYGEKPTARFSLSVEPLPLLAIARKELYTEAKKELRRYYPRTLQAQADLTPSV